MGFSLHSQGEEEGQFAFTWNHLQCAFNMFPQSHLHCQAMCHRWAGLDLQQAQVTTGVLVIHCINDILIVGPTEKQVEVVLQLVTVTSESRALNPDGVQGPAQQVQVLRGHVGGKPKKHLRFSKAKNG